MLKPCAPNARFFNKAVWQCLNNKTHKFDLDKFLKSWQGFDGRNLVRRDESSIRIGQAKFYPLTEESMWSSVFHERHSGPE